MGRPSAYAPEVRERAVRMVQEHASESVAVGGDSLDRREDRLHARDLRRWVRQAERDRASGPA